MQTPLQIGITGGIGTGKSLVCKIFHALGVPAYDADSRAKKLMTTDGILIGQIQKEFGTLSYDARGVLNREYLSATVFNDEAKLKRLNELVHPRVGEDYKQWVAARGNVKYVLKEAALLFESGSYRSLDKIIVVSAPVEVRIKRVLARDRHRSKTDIEMIMNNQLPELVKESKADFVIRNDEVELVIPQVLKLHERLNSTN
ncbi:MAG: dephospho-CoA kinase [Cyclobacteriaceae bacterium]|jgi:dephospho-CoA kinase|nr:dephospho-CoA kinase [Cyclobacteriaceae bacterium]